MKMKTYATANGDVVSFAGLLFSFDWDKEIGARVGQ